MSKKFAFSANAEPFVPVKSIPWSETPEGITEHRDNLLRHLKYEKRKNEKLQRGIEALKSSEIKMNKLKEENERLNKEIRSDVTKLLAERDSGREKDVIISEKQMKIDSQLLEISTIHSRYYQLDISYNDMKSRFEDSTKKKEEWIGRCLKLDFIFKKMKQIGALPEDHGSWVWDMVEDIEFPNGSLNSVFHDLPTSIRERFLPSSQDAGLVFQEDENNIIEDLSYEAELFNQNLSENFRRNLDENPELIMNHIRTIQTRFREYIRPNFEKRIKAAIKIQSVRRGLCGRGIITYKGTLEVDISLMKCKLILDKKIKSTHQIVPEHKGDRPFRMNFANTGKNIIHYQWMKIQPHTLEGTIGTGFSIKPGEVISIKVYFGHWFRFMSESDEEEQYFRIMPEGFLGNLGRVVFDLNTKLTVTKDHYYEWSRGLYGPHAIRVPNTNNSIIRTEDDRFNRILNTDHLNIHNNSSVPDEGEDESDEDDDARLMLAIQLSLG